MGKPIVQLLAFFARHGRLVLVAGLVAGLMLPDLAAKMYPYLGQMVAITLFLAALRIGPKDAFDSLKEMRGTFALLGCYQIALPIAFALLLPLTGLSLPLTTAITMMAAAPSLTGSPNLTLMMGENPAPALYLLIIGTAVLPLTSFVVFLVVPGFGSAANVIQSAVNLLLLIVASTGAAFALRDFVFKNTTTDFFESVDGLSALALGGIVIGLMTAVTPALHSDPFEVAFVLAIACITGFGLQIIAFGLLKKTADHSKRVGYAIIAGCRNSALFLGALPSAVTDPLLLFIGCYQIPMYLTPLLMRRFYTLKKD